MKQDYSTTPIPKVGPLKKWDIRTIRFLIICGLITMLIFVIWFARPEHIGCGPLFWLLCAGLVFKLVKMLHEWYHYWSLSIPVMPQTDKTYAVDVLTTACPGEPQEMIINTLKAMVAITYPHKNYLCDEGNDPALKKVCEELGVIHVTREIKTNAKAGNINNALSQASGEICVVLDPDHIPVPEFLDRVLPYFEDQTIGYVQCVQGYYNQDDSIIARGAAEQTYHFYGPMMMCMNTYGTVQAIGANCTFRRKALDTIGGHAAGLAEDMHTAMQLHAKGWRSIYVPEMLTKGLVPATLSAYYKQQLKWSRGTFELLFHTYPGLCKNFTWRQKIHYLCIPLYFLFGLINLIDVLIPSLALVLAEVPWEVDINNFAILFVPLCTLSLVIRLFAQRWLLEKHERGLHLAGGILRTATWWIFLIGFIYSIFNIKVPYIPTPKEDVHENYWRLSIPNFIITILCSAVILYGLSIDWTPYSIAMAFYALINVGIMGFVVIMSQQKLLESISKKIKAITFLTPVLNFAGWAELKIRNSFYTLLQSAPIALLIAGALVFLSYNNTETELDIADVRHEKFIGGFYQGISLNTSKISPAEAFEKHMGRSFDIVTMNDTLGKQNRSTNDALQSIARNGYTPLIHMILPMDEQYETDWKGILANKYDTYLEQYAGSLRAFASPVFMSPVLNIKPGTTNASDMILGWQYLYTFFNAGGVSNITWVWTPEATDIKKYYPGAEFADWIGVRALNYSYDRTAHDWRSFRDKYMLQRKKLLEFQKPVIVTEFGSLKGGSQSDWLTKAYKDIESFKEIKAAVLFNRKYTWIKQIEGQNAIYTADFSLTTKTIIALKEIYASPFYKEKPFYKVSRNNPYLELEAYNSPFVKGTQGNFQLVVNNKPWYIRGVAYNTGHDWRDGNMPLTRRRLEEDFQHIKDMGANTIRRYSFSMYDKNVLNVADEFDLKVQYGFWFDPRVDYYRDSARVQEYIDDVTKKVIEYRGHPSILAWSVGNETWGLLKHRFSKPYLTKVRECYVRMLERMAEKIHELDPSRPVFSSMEHEKYQLAGEIVAFHDGAPALDVIGVNSYYKEQISILKQTFCRFDSTRPYLVSEFGPRGYWDPRFNRAVNGVQIEDRDSEKAQWFKDQWTNYIIANKGYNIGGFAYCWHDRMEGSYTWFGLSDHLGRLKPSYYALKELWTNQKAEFIPSVTIEMPKNLIPGKEYDISTITNAPHGKNFKYEWLLLKNEYMASVDELEPSENGRSVKVRIPNEASNYRLYLYVSDGNKNVTTASAPIRVN
ncbi:MAG: family 2 glycosyl transferase [Bacteroidetes bacterium]|jgi:cellulose synthase/poly-beta-1,6-N-acetylglucosamine synthase-like glycosyltransferase|nr:family 2 glycosyl transferase [Bacteroidota bacterium]